MTVPTEASSVTVAAVLSLPSTLPPSVLVLLRLDQLNVCLFALTYMSGPARHCRKCRREERVKEFLLLLKSILNFVLGASRVYRNSDILIFNILQENLLSCL